MFNFPNPLKSIFGSRCYLGVDIGTTSIKIAEIAKAKSSDTGPKFKLTNYGLLETYSHLERVNSAIQASGLKIVEKEAASLLKMLLEKSNFKCREAVASLPPFAAFITLMEMPQMPEADMEQAMKFQIQQNIPMSLEEVAIDWMKVGMIEDKRGFNQQQILLIAISKEQINSYRNIFKLAGLQLKALEIENLALIRALISPGSPPTLIVDIGGRSTNIVIFDKNSLKHSAQTDFAGGVLKQAISKGLNISSRRAEELKKQKGLLGGGGPFELSTLTLPFLDVIIKEVKRVKESYEKNFPDASIQHLMLAGGGANMLGIAQYFEREMNLPAVVATPFSQIDYPIQIEPLAKELRALLAVAIGLGMRG